MANPPPKYSPRENNNGSVEKLLGEYGEDELQSSASEPVRRWSLLRRLLPWSLHACLLSFNVLLFLAQLVGGLSRTDRVLLYDLNLKFERFSLEYDMVKVEALCLRTWVLDPKWTPLGTAPHME
jgi:hypothetical protein